MYGNGLAQEGARMLEDYAKARKLGLKQVERDVSDGVRA